MALLPRLVVPHNLSMQDLPEILQAILDRQDEIARAIGHEDRDEYGKLTGTGVVGRVMRTELAVKSLMDERQSWKRYFAGALMSATLLICVIWWLVSQRLGAILQ